MRTIFTALFFLFSSQVWSYDTNFYSSNDDDNDIVLTSESEHVWKEFEFFQKKYRIRIKGLFILSLL